jgi:hypothetical protein
VIERSSNPRDNVYSLVQLFFARRNDVIARIGTKRSSAPPFRPPAEYFLQHNAGFRDNGCRFQLRFTPFSTSPASRRVAGSRDHDLSFWHSGSPTAAPEDANLPPVSLHSSSSLHPPSSLNSLATMLHGPPPKFNFQMQETAIIVAAAATMVYTAHRHINAALSKAECVWHLLPTLGTLAPILGTPFLCYPACSPDFV